MKEMEFEAIWNKSKNKLPINQKEFTERIFFKAKSHGVCWICGDSETQTPLHLISTKTHIGVVEGVLCEDCMEIQKGMK